MKKIHILLIEDEIAISDMIQFSLSVDQYDIDAVTHVPAAKQKLVQKIPDVIVLDWMLPGEGGPSFLKWLKQHEAFHQIPVIMLTAKAEEANKVSMLMLGADDYMTKPFSPKELMARIQAIMRRGPIIAKQNIIHAGKLKLNVTKQHITIDDQSLNLTSKEYKTLELFIRNPEKKYTRDMLIDRIWGGENYIDDRTVDVHIRRLRDKLKPFAIADYIQTQRGVGYFFKVT